MIRITKGDFIHKVAFDFHFGDVVEVLIAIDYSDTVVSGPVYGVVVSESDLDFPEDEVNDIQVIVGSNLFCLHSSDIRKVCVKPFNVVSVEIE